MSNKDDRIKHLEEEILAARKTINSLTKTIEELSRKVGMYHSPPVYTYPYVYKYPYWTYTVGDVSYTSSVGLTGTFSAQDYRGGAGTTTTNTYYINKSNDEGDEGVGVAV